ncbi:hypothetical protein NUW58_g471 [Xylaria curta]|uniref:Uncharacterized protein n=1 Tax=Xylaria curta TaxID=42375 RepID=A0ACC1PSG7_9PEZI|nr:hypothetical protein NUW58_g471 [Xylaria curta]
MTRDDGGDASAASEYLDDERFHRSFTLPPSAARTTEFKVTYADFGHQNADRVLLVCGPLVGTRFLLPTKDKLAQKYGVRIISPDRPGFGGTTDIGPPDRVRVWLEIVEALLKHLAISHVSLLGYSGGSVYAMNVLLHQRHLLHPTRPYVAICTPWVHPSHSGVSMLKLAGFMPNALVGNFDRMVHFFHTNISPAVKFSTDLSGLMKPLGQRPDVIVPEADPHAVAFEEDLFPEIIRRINAEDMRGLGQDSLLLLKRDEYPGCWGAWGDYDTLVPLLARAEMERRTTGSSDISPLRVDVFYAESDMIIGSTAAPTWFDSCWRPEQRGDHIQYSSATIPKTIHDSILDLRYGVAERIFQGMST